ncbi:hypothetical protein CKAH01_07292 [Colletotrichum kahawae]|uniref:Uncharacterized protein n=1 Tax=Colletotrichum kahawae TaxID=34407 RepID=A0AAD9Y4H7_COLKA|nr:hypothetical protein CKAH01_07292 [Colletotrichum kahawae]
MHRPADGRTPARSGDSRPGDDPRLRSAQIQSGAVDRPISSGTHSDGYSRASACLALEFISRNSTSSFAIMPYQVSANTSMLIRRFADRGPTPPDAAAKLSAWLSCPRRRPPVQRPMAPGSRCGRVTAAEQLCLYR